MKKTLLLFLPLTFLNADIYSDITNNPKQIVKLLKNTPIQERKDICLKLMNDNEDTNPKLAFAAGNCLLYNGYGSLAVPLFTKYIYGENNAKYFNNRIGYGWLHSADWYKVGNKVLFKMTDGKDLFTWINHEINNEVHKNYKKYNLSLDKVIKNDLKQYSRLGKLTKEQETEIKKCKIMTVNINNITCTVEGKIINDCRETKDMEFSLNCLKNK